MPVTDQELVRRCLRGETEPFGTLYDRYAPRIHGLLQRLSGNPTQAEDLTQETFVAAYGALASWQGRGPFNAWLYGIALRLYRKSLRKPCPVDMETYEMDHLAAPNADPLDVLTRDELEQAIERAIAALPEHYREVFVLLRIEGCSQREAAQMLDIPIGTVQSRLGRAVSKLRSRLMGEGMVRDDGEIEKGGADHAVQFRA